MDFAMIILLSPDFDSTMNGNYILPYYFHNCEEKLISIRLMQRNSK